MRHRRKPKPNLDEKIKPPQVDDPEEALRHILGGAGARPEDWDEEEEADPEGRWIAYIPREEDKKAY